MTGLISRAIDFLSRQLDRDLLRAGDNRKKLMMLAHWCSSARLPIYDRGKKEGQWTSSSLVEEWVA